MADGDLTTEHGMKAYLVANFDSTCHTVERLTEGFGNYVYRVQLDRGNSVASTVIAKYGASYAARAPSWKLSQTRVGFEQKALTYLSTLQKEASAMPAHVHVPKVLRYDDASHVIIMEDVGVLPSLKGWLQPDVSVDTVKQIGASLGEFLAHLHNVTSGKSAIKDGFCGNECAKYLSPTLYFDRLPSAAAKFGYTDDERIIRAAQTGAEEVRESEEVLTIGDFWTGNVLVSTSAERNLRLYAIDWELCKPGPACFDIGQMAAEMYCLAAFRDRQRGMVLLESFLSAYRTGRKGSIDVAGVAIRIGAHLVVMMPNAWRNEGSEEQIRSEVAVGVELVRRGIDRDTEGLSGSLVRSLVA